MEAQTISGMPVIGKYKWEFEIPGSGTQTSVHEFFPGHIQYSMAGPAHSTAYTQNLVAFDPAEQRCITVGSGGDKEGVYFLMFFRYINDEQVTIYKRKCATREEAENFPVPAMDATEDHGWNVYTKV